MEWLTAFDGLIAQHSANDDPSAMNPPASLESIRAFETELAKQDRVKGFRLPPSCEAFLLRYDGGDVVDDKAGVYVNFLNVAVDEKPWTRLTLYNDADSVLMDHQIPTYFTFEPLVMIAMDEGSNFWGLDQSERRNDGEMPIRYCDHETGDIYAQSDDFASFIQAIADQKLEYRELNKPIVKGHKW